MTAACAGPLLVMRLMDRGGVLERFGSLASCLAIAALVGCGHSPQLAGIAASGARTSATPTVSLPAASTQTAGVFGKCRLPVMIPHTRTQADPRAGWLDVPAGTYSPDPSSDLAGATMVAWDGGVGKWVPTEPSYISPDGLDYVAENVPDIEIVDARTGDIVHRTSAGFANRVVAYTRTAVYLDSNGEYRSRGSGRWTRPLDS
ncbi:MAG TPA: hypothetical protein VLK30_09570 [Candidatus Limnocylindrales bacterium]|nr:hypothetical protein [Candidatus Limnocylindrales bacterium]